MGMESLLGCSGFSSKPTTLPLGVELGHAEALGVLDAVEERARTPGAVLERRPRPRPGARPAGRCRRARRRTARRPRTPGRGRWRGRCRASHAGSGSSGRGPCSSPSESSSTMSPMLRPPRMTMTSVMPMPASVCQRVVDHGPVVDRQQVLVGDEGQRVQARTGASREDHSLHVALRGQVPGSSRDLCILSGERFAMLARPRRRRSMEA